MTLGKVESLEKEPTESETETFDDKIECSDETVSQKRANHVKREPRSGDFEPQYLDIDSNRRDHK